MKIIKYEYSHFRGFYFFVIFLYVNALNNNYSHNNIFICLLGSYRIQQFSNNLKHGLSYESHLEVLANKLYHNNISFMIITPEILPSIETNNSYPFNSSIYYTSSSTNESLFINDAKNIILSKSPNILWTVGKWSLDFLPFVDIPTIVTLSEFNEEHIYNFTSNSRILYRFYHQRTMDNFILKYPIIQNNSFLLSSGENEIKVLLDYSEKLLSNKIILLNSNSVDDLPIIYIGNEIFSIYNISSNYKSNKPLVVGSMTTTPARMKEILGPFGLTIKRILSYNIIDRLYINVPWYYELRSKSELIEIPADLIKMSSEYKGRLRILRCKDYGPSTKLLPTILMSNDDLPLESMIITFDDDRLYTFEAVKALISNAASHPNTVITIAAWPITILSSHGKRGIPDGPNFHSKLSSNIGIQYKKSGYVDLILGFYGVLYKKSMFLPLPNEIFNYNALPEFKTFCMWVDDIWISGYLEYKNIPRWVIGNVPDTGADITKLSNTNALSLEQGESVKQNKDNVRCAEALRKKYGIWN